MKKLLFALLYYSGVTRFAAWWNRVEIKHIGDLDHYRFGKGSAMVIAALHFLRASL